MNFDVSNIRKDFPSLHQTVYGKPLVYLDNAATSQKPISVIEAISGYYSTINSNVHRGVHFLSQKATDAFEGARNHICSYLNARHSHEIIYTRGATDAINLVASSFGKKYIRKGDEVIVSALEHHANIVPWQTICNEKQAKLRVIPMNDDGELLLSEFETLMNDRTRMVAIGHISNALGIINPVKTITALAHQRGIPVMIDGAQGIVHKKVDVQELDCDFYCFSGHKFYGPMGIGVLYGKEEILNELPPYQTGGEMIKTVTFEKTTFNDLPFKFESGTPNVADVIGFDRSLSYIESIGMDQIESYEDDLLDYASRKLMMIHGLKIYGEKCRRSGVISFTLDRIHPYDAGTIIDKFGIALRTGNHCAQPVMDRLNIPGTLRASFAFYNTKEEADVLADAILKVQEMLG